MGFLELFLILSYTPTGSWDATFRVWDSSAYTLLIKKDAGVQSVTLCVTADARLFTGSQDGCLKLWMGDLTVSGGNLTVAKQVNKAHTDIIRRIVFSAASEKLFTTSNDQCIKIWLAADLTELSVLAGHSAFVFDLALGSGDALFSGGEERSVGGFSSGGEERSVGGWGLFLWRGGAVGRRV